ncbi:hypothetical protein OSB04_020480 [Centaurea solstitialis]|uniref:Uncharacterized protein n=1 Tax=Centaurea solstitialis TaxID=347529 RepID=A0AA38W5X2_9ASTR|nr:hypothetical protein OSB04_020480 [Centaurea solstitialis]
MGMLLVAIGFQDCDACHVLLMRMPYHLHRSLAHTLCKYPTPFECCPLQYNLHKKNKRTNQGLGLGVFACGLSKREGKARLTRLKTLEP